MLEAWRGIRTRAGRSAAILLAAALAAGLLGATEVGACQPPPEGSFPDSRDVLQSGDGAFIGVLESERRTDDYDEFIFTFRVLETIKGSFADTVEVTIHRCGRPFIQVGDERGVVVDEYLGEWNVYNYEQFRDPDALRRAALPLPELVDDEPVAVAGAALGDIRSVAIAQSGAPVGYGRGDGNVSLVDVCPGGRRAVEIYPRFEDYSPSYWLTVRALPHMLLVSERRVPVEVDALRCASDYARRIFVWGMEDEWPPPSPVVLRLNAGEFHLVARTPGAGDTLTFSATHAFFSRWDGETGERIVAVDLRSGEKHRVFRFEHSFVDRLAVSPNGRYLVALLPGPRRDNHAVVINADTRTRVSRTRLPERGRATPEWANNRRIVLWYPAIGRLEVLDRRLHSRNVVEGWPTAEPATYDGHIYGIGRSGPSSGKVYRTTLNSPSPVTEIFDLLAEFAFDIEAIS